ncbi:transcriptional regulator, ArsR family [Nocardioides sp. YR527]|uniref:ArsR/SmtB family transcription factor n=1 Tax=Nocardioides sp. YR527 TaxID=1881028 RepID=UPI0008818D44|nr:helix-turn-helix domain-containing protein [Nocardioides sp. YR527]SDK70946.1 transcriptional regulator, ArsR family [Nocardioides sp. YR527]
MDEEISRLRAAGHPLRLRMLSLLTGAELSAAEVARELDLTHANASYHLRLLESAGLLEVAGEERIRGGVAKRYRYAWRSETAEGPPSREDDEVHTRAIAEELVRRRRLRADGPAIISDAEMWVDPDIWQRVHDLVQEASGLLHENARPPRTEGTIHVNLTASAFVMGEDQ